MPGLSGGHLIWIVILLIVVLIIWGPGKLPDVGSGLGRAIREFKKASTETRDEFAKATRPDAPADATAAGAASAPVPSAPAVAPVVPTSALEPTPVGASVARPVEHVATEGDPTSTS